MLHGSSKSKCVHQVDELFVQSVFTVQCTLLHAADTHALMTNVDNHSSWRASRAYWNPVIGLHQIRYRGMLSLVTFDVSGLQYAAAGREWKWKSGLARRVCTVPGTAVCSVNTGVHQDRIVPLLTHSSSDA